MDNEIIWDYPKDFDIKNIHYAWWRDNNGISQLIRDYIDTPMNELPEKEFDNEKKIYFVSDFIKQIDDKFYVEYHFTELFKAADRRLGKEKLLNWAKSINNPKVDRILELRFGWAGEEK